MLFTFGSSTEMGGVVSLKRKIDFAGVVRVVRVVTGTFISVQANIWKDLPGMNPAWQRDPYFMVSRIAGSSFPSLWARPLLALGRIEAAYHLNILTCLGELPIETVHPLPKNLGSIPQSPQAIRRFRPFGPLAGDSRT